MSHSSEKVEGHPSYWRGLNSEEAEGCMDRDMRKCNNEWKVLETGWPRDQGCGFQRATGSAESRKDSSSLRTLEMHFKVKLHCNYLHFYSCLSYLTCYLIKVGWQIVILQSRTVLVNYGKNHGKHQQVDLILRFFFFFSFPHPGVDWPLSSLHCRRHFGTVVCSVRASNPWCSYLSEQPAYILLLLHNLLAIMSPGNLQVFSIQKFKIQFYRHTTSNHLLQIM